MLQSVSELVGSLYEAFGKGDMPYVLGMFAPELVWNEAENFVYADRNPYVGPQAVLEGVFKRLATGVGRLCGECRGIVGSGDTAVALGPVPGGRIRPRESLWTRSSCMSGRWPRER